MRGKGWGVEERGRRGEAYSIPTPPNLENEYREFQRKQISSHMIFLWERKLGMDMIKIYCIHIYIYYQRINKNIPKKNVRYQFKHPKLFLGIRVSWLGTL